MKRNKSRTQIKAPPEAPPTKGEPQTRVSVHQSGLVSFFYWSEGFPAPVVGGAPEGGWVLAVQSLFVVHPSPEPIDGQHRGSPLTDSSPQTRRIFSADGSNNVQGHFESHRRSRAAGGGHKQMGRARLMRGEADPAPPRHHFLLYQQGLPDSVPPHKHPAALSRFPAAPPGGRSNAADHHKRHDGHKYLPVTVTTSELAGYRAEEKNPASGEVGYHSS